MEKFREYTVPYSCDCRRRHRHKYLHGKILEFCTQLEIKFEGTWHIIVRYDTSHGFSHKDILHADGTGEKIPLGISGYNEALTFAQIDLDANWPIYKKRFYKEVGYHE